MVNTFLLHSDFATSARLLDSKRLGKQRVEAMQILHLIQYLQILANRYSSPQNSTPQNSPAQNSLTQDSPGPVPPNPYDRYDWIRKVARTYNSSPTRLLYRNGQWHSIDKSIKMIRMATNEVITSEENGKVKLTDVNTQRNRNVDSKLLVRTDEIYISLGFVYHPAVLMWLGHEDSLKDYINVHIDEWIKRGFKNTINKYEIKGFPIQPPWTYDSYLHLTHKCNLLRKELENEEPKHYQDMFDCKSLDIEMPYFWPYTPKVSAGICDSRKRYMPQITVIDSDSFNVRSSL